MPSTVLGARAAAVRETIAELAEAGLDPQELVHEVSERVRRVVPYDWGSWSTNDPETLLQTEALVAEGFVDCAFGVEQMRIELEGGDVNLFDALDRSGAIAASLSGATGGDLAASARHRAVFAPRGLDDELRVLARSGDATWGTAQLARAADAPPFSEDEIRFVASIATHLGAGLRAGLARMPVAAPASGGAGMLVLGPGGEIEASTADAERWLARMHAPWGRDYLPPTIEGVAEHARGIARGGADLRPARLRLRIPGEGWLLVRADVLNAASPGGPSVDGDGAAAGGGTAGAAHGGFASAGGTPGADPAAEARVAVMIEPAARADLVPLLHAIHGLTARERAVTELLVSGRSTDAIADRLAISRHTLRDHVKAIFTKVGVGSRPELTAVFGTEAPAR